MVIESAGSTAPRPRLLAGGFGTTIAAAVAGIATTVFWLLVYGSALDSVSRTANGREALAGLDGFFYLIIALSFIFAIGLGAGAITMWFGSNVGRILIWTFGGVMIAWHLCCGTYGMFVSSLVVAYDRRGSSSGQSVPYWQMDLAIIAGFVAAVLSVVAIILIAQSSVNIYFRKLSGESAHGRQVRYRQHPGSGVYEPYGPEPAPSTRWPHSPEQAGPSRPIETWSDPTQPDETVWRRPGAGDGDDESFKPPR